MQAAFQEQLDELKTMKKEEEKQKQNEIEQQQQRLEHFSSEVETIKHDFDVKMNSIEDEFHRICHKQEELIDNGVVQKYHQMILETITFGQFRKFEDQLKDHFIKEFYKILQTNEHELIHLKVILNCISIPESYENIQIIQVFKGDVKHHSKIRITNTIIEDLYQKGQLDSCLMKCVYISNDLLVEIEYPCNQFEQKMKIISDIKMQNEQATKVSLTINDKSYFDAKNKWTKIINICKVAQSVNVLPPKSFFDFTNLTVLELSPDTISIETSAFQNCSSLKEMTIPSTVKSIDEHCFDGCSKLDPIMINPFYTQIQFNKFNKCSLMEHFTISTKRDKLKTNDQIFIPDNITDLLYQTNFFNSPELTSYIIECSEIIFEIEYPSSNFTNIYQTVINLKQNNSSKIQIGIFYGQLEATDKYFNNNEDINYLRFDSNIKRTSNDGDDKSDGSFEGCSSLIEVFIPSSLEKIGNRTFYYCTSLQKINFEDPSSVTSIRDYAFCNCTSLTHISIPSSVTSIGDYAFNCCTSLTQISIPSSVTSIGNYTFNCCRSLTQISIPSFVTSIGNRAFNNCKSLTQISIPSSVTSIGDYAFNWCTSLTQISIPSGINTQNLGINSNVKINQI